TSSGSPGGPFGPSVPKGGFTDESALAGELVSPGSSRALTGHRPGVVHGHRLLLRGGDLLQRNEHLQLRSGLGAVRQPGADLLSDLRGVGAVLRRQLALVLRVRLLLLRVGQRHLRRHHTLLPGLPELRLDRPRRVPEETGISGGRARSTGSVERTAGHPPLAAGRLVRCFTARRASRAGPRRLRTSPW